MSRKVACKMLELYPTDVAYLAELAGSEDGLGDKEKAASLFRNVLILDPQNVAAQAYLKISKKKVAPGGSGKNE